MNVTTTHNQNNLECTVQLCDIGEWIENVIFSLQKPKSYKTDFLYKHWNILLQTI